MTEYSAIILAGGKSSRMEQKKSTLLIQGRTFMDIIMDKLVLLGIKDIIISGYDEISDELKNNELKNNEHKLHNCQSVRYRCVEDIYPDKGPLAGIHAGLAVAECATALVIPEDAPLVPDQFLIKLMEEHARNSFPITAASTGDRLQPLIAVYEKSLTPLCEKFLKGEKATVMSMIDEVGCCRVPFTENEILLRGCNTPEEYRDMSMLC